MEKNITKKLCSILLSFAIVLTSVCIPSVSVSADGESATTDLATFAIDSSKDKWTDDTDVYWGKNEYSSVGPDEESGSTMSDGSDKVAVRMSKDAIGQVTFTNKGSDKSISATVNVSVTDNTGNAKNVYTKTETIAAGDTFVFDGWKASQNYVIKKWSAKWNELDSGNPSIVLTISAIIPVENIIITGADTSNVNALQTVQLGVSVEPENATNQNINWYSGNEKVATVENGLVTTKYPGTAVITAVAEDTSWATSQATRDVVVDYTKVQNFTLDKQKLELYMNGNDSYCPDEEDYKSCTYDSIVNYTLTSNVKPSDATYKTVTYSTKNNAPVKTGDTVATVNESTGYIEAVAPGTITVVGTTGMSGLDEQTAEVAVTVKVHTTGVKFVDKSQVSAGEPMDELDVYLNSENDLKGSIVVEGYNGYEATDPTYTLTSDDTDIVEIVDGTKIKAKKLGTATITVKTTDREWTDTLTVNVRPQVEDVTLDKTTATVWYNGKPKQVVLTASLTPETAMYDEVKWEVTEGKDLIEVVQNEKNELKATVKIKDSVKKAGTAKVKVTVISNGTYNTATSTISVSAYVKELEIAESATIYANCDGDDHTVDLSKTLVVSPSDAYDKTVTWTSSDESVATVDEKTGVVTAVGEGTATITATANGYKGIGKKHAVSNECEVHVQLHPKSIDITGEKNEITGETSTVYINSTKESFTKTKLTATITPENASYTDKKVEWVVADADKDMVTITTDENDSTIAYVTSNAKKTGTAKITAKVTYLENGKEKVTVESEPYTVYVEKLVESITTENGDRTNDITIYTNAKNDADKKAEIEAIVNPDDAYVKSLDEVFGPNGGFYIWKASGSTASISLVKDTDNLNKATIKALAPGKLEIYAKAKGVTTSYPSDLFAKWNVNVVELVEGIELNKATTSIQEGSNETLVATIKNETASDKSVTWTSSDPSIATVDASGKVVAKKTGTVTITATANDKYDPDGTIGGYNKVATCKVTVTAKPAETKVVTCEEANGKGWVWSEAKKACVYKVTNTSAE